jgi:glutathione S-transferase
MNPEQKIILHGARLSGHSHRAELMLNLLGLTYEFRQVDLLAGEQRRPEFLRLNPFGTVPVIEDGDDVVADSVAILVYLAQKYDAAHRWLPTDPLAAAKVQRWLSVAQGDVFNGPCKARLAKVFGAPFDHGQAVKVADRLLKILDAHITGSAFFTGAAATLADVALYSYIAKAPEGGVALDAFQNVRSWLQRVEALPGFLPMPQAG